MKQIILFWKKYSVLAMFIIYIFAICIFNITNLCNAIKQSFRSCSLDTAMIEDTYKNNFYNRLAFVDIQGLVARLAGQKINNGVIKGNDGKLNLLDTTDYKYNESDEKSKSEKAIAILEHAQENGSKVLFVQRPWATGELPYGYNIELDQQYDYWCKIMSIAGFPVLDLRQMVGDEIKFYITDHHWTMESGFNANKAIINSLNNEYNLGLDHENVYTDIGQYKKINYEKSFLGSEGIRVGKFFAGKDDFEILVPKFNTDFTHAQYKNGKQYWASKGTYEDVFINIRDLENPNYNNKYNVIAYGAYIENIITNHFADNDLKVLLIADSFGRPLVTYLACNFRETRYLDPQEGRYNESFVEYIDEFKPDVVIMMTSGDLTFKKI